jgi:uncharacterized protein
MGEKGHCGATILSVTGVPVWFRFHGELNDFLTVNRRNTEFEHAAGRTDTVKHVIESLGVPHTEVGQIRANGQIVPASARVTEGGHLEVYPHPQPVILNQPRFVLDGHLGRLAAYLRMLGFDVWYDRFADDARLAAVSGGEGRTLLTRDVGLLKRREVESGYCVRHDKPHDQLREVSRRFALYSHFLPFTRCMDCNGPLCAVAKDEVADLLPPHTRETKNEFSRCEVCRKVFWRGTHYDRLLTLLESLTANP